MIVLKRTRSNTEAFPEENIELVGSTGNIYTVSACKPLSDVNKLSRSSGLCSSKDQTTSKCTAIQTLAYHRNHGISGINPHLSEFCPTFARV